VSVTADGSGLVMADAKLDAASKQAATPASKAAPQDLEAELDSALPVPKEHSMSSIGVGKLPGTETAIRRELNASIPADLNSVLAFYRAELGKRGWKEAAERAVVKSDQAQLAFVSPDGPATLKLGRSNDETSVNLAQKIPAAAAKGDVMPKPGQARLMFVNIGDSEAALTINKQTIKIAAGAGGAHAKGPTLDLPPGKYQYSVKVAGRPAGNSEIEIAADDTWGLMVAPGWRRDAATGVLRQSAAALGLCPPAACHFRSTSPASLVEKADLRAEKRSANRAFAKAPNQPPDALKNSQKILFIQQLADTDFALGGLRLSWHK